MSKYNSIPVRTADNSPLRSNKSSKSNRRWEAKMSTHEKPSASCQNTLVAPYAELLVESLSLHFVPTLANHFAGANADGTRKDLMSFVLKYLDKKEATPRHLGAFSFCVREFGSNLYATQNHFVYENPEYANVYVSFGGSLNATISSNGSGPKLSQKIKLPVIDKRMTKFSADLLDTFGGDAAYFDLPLPQGRDFDLMSEATIENYISAGVGPRMLADVSGKVTADIIDKIFDRCLEVSILPGMVQLIPQMLSLVTVSDVEENWLALLIKFTDDRVFADVIEQYGTSFRFYYLTPAQQKQILGLPVGVSITREFLNKLVFSVIKDTENGIDTKRLLRNCEKYNIEHIDSKRRECELMTGKKCKVTYDVDEGEDIFHYSPVDLFVYLLGDTLHVTTTENILLLAEGTSKYHDKAIDEGIVERAVEHIGYIEDSDLLFPPSTVDEMAELLIHPSTSIVERLNDTTF